MNDPAETGPANARQRHELQVRIARWLDLPLAVLALATLALLVVEFTLPLSPEWARRIAQVQTVIWIVFLADFLLELGLAPSKLRYLRKNWLTALAVALPALRAIRLLRVARALRGLSLARIVTSLNRGTRALGHVARRGQFGYVALLTLVVTATAAAGTYYLERDQPGASIGTPGEALWWAATLVTTISSPLEPVTFEGRLIALLLRAFALAISGYLTAIIAVYLIGGERPPGPGKPAASEELKELRLQLSRVERLLHDRDGAAAGENRPTPGRANRAPRAPT